MEATEVASQTNCIYSLTPRTVSRHCRFLSLVISFIMSFIAIYIISILVHKGTNILESAKRGSNNKLLPKTNCGSLTPQKPSVGTAGFCR